MQSWYGISCKVPLLSSMQKILCFFFFFYMGHSLFFFTCLDGLSRFGICRYPTVLPSFTRFSWLSCIPHSSLIFVFLILPLLFYPTIVLSVFIIVVRSSCFVLLVFTRVSAAYMRTRSTVLL